MSSPFTTKPSRKTFLPVLSNKLGILPIFTSEASSRHLNWTALETVRVPFHCSYSGLKFRSFLKCSSRRTDNPPLNHYGFQEHHGPKKPSQTSCPGHFLQTILVPVQHDGHRTTKPSDCRNRYVLWQSLWIHFRIYFYHLQVDYSSAAVFEVRQPNGGGEPVLRFRFKNGTEDQFNTYPFMNSRSDVPVSTFINSLQVWASFIPTEMAELTILFAPCSPTHSQISQHGAKFAITTRIEVVPTS